MNFFNTPWKSDPGTVLGMWALLDKLFGRERATDGTSLLAVTINGATLVGGILSNTGAPAGGVTYTTDPAINIIGAAAGAQGGNIAIGWSTVFRLHNPSGQTLTVAGGTGVSVAGTATVLTNTWREFLVIVTNVGVNAAVTLTNIGAGTV